jgi:hypothetical protein
MIRISWPRRSWPRFAIARDLERAVDADAAAAVDSAATKAFQRARWQRHLYAGSYMAVFGDET